MYPKLVEFFKDVKVKHVGAGLYHSVAVTESGDLYTWGKGLYGVLGNGSNSYALSPTINEEFAAMKKQGINIVKVDTAEDYTAVLMDNNELYTFGKNDRGQMGIGTGTGMDMVECSVFPQAVCDESMELFQVKDFYCG